MYTCQYEAGKGQLNYRFLSFVDELVYEQIRVSTK